MWTDLLCPLPMLLKSCPLKGAFRRPSLREEDGTSVLVKGIEWLPCPISTTRTWRDVSSLQPRQGTHTPTLHTEPHHCHHPDSGFPGTAGDTSEALCQGSWNWQIGLQQEHLEGPAFRRDRFVLWKLIPSIYNTQLSPGLRMGGAWRQEWQEPVAQG